MRESTFKTWNMHSSIYLLDKRRNDWYLWLWHFSTENTCFPKIDMRGDDKWNELAIGRGKLMQARIQYIENAMKHRQLIVQEAWNWWYESSSCFINRPLSVATRKAKIPPSFPCRVIWFIKYKPMSRPTYTVFNVIVHSRQCELNMHSYACSISRQCELNMHSYACSIQLNKYALTGVLRRQGKASR